MQNPKDYIVKSPILTVNGEVNKWYSLSSFQYGNISVKKVKDPIQIKGVRVFNHCLIIKNIEDVYFLDATTGRYIPFNDDQKQYHIVTYIKHFVADLNLTRCHSTVKTPIILDVIDLPSITLSYDENGMNTVTLFNGKLIK
jgi:hypothetical protein